MFGLDQMPCINQTLAENISSTADSFTMAPEPEALRIVRTVLFSLIAVLALVGNYVVCRAVWRNPGAKPVAHYLVSNLAFAEIISMVCLVFTFHAYEPPWSWELGYIMCKILDPLQVASLLVITTTLAILAVYRCVLLIKPLVIKPTRRQTRCVILVIWVGSVGLSVPAGHFRVVNSYGDNCDIHACQEVFPEGFKHYQDIYSIVLFVINFALPLVTMTIAYSLVSKKIRQHIFVVKRLRDQPSKAVLPLVQQSTCVQGQTGLANQTRIDNQERIELLKVGIGSTEMVDRKPQTKGRDDINRANGKSLPHNQSMSRAKSNKDTFELENDILKMVSALVVTFAVCYLPYQLQFLMVEFNVKEFLFWPQRYTFSRIVFTLTCLPSALHPVCYGMMSKFYHKVFIRMIACRR